MLSLDEVEKIVRSNQDSIVIVDEAYIDFGGVSALSLVPRYENLLVVQTFSKSKSMAGIRIGFAIGNPRLIRALNDVKYSYNSYTMNMPSLILGKEAVKDDAYFKGAFEEDYRDKGVVEKAVKAVGLYISGLYVKLYFCLS